ncbi:MAG TPA: nuclear transport factor 2 family protein [bacterium]|nr:nuclear transport factor 2 family protein [bacterium]
MSDAGEVRDLITAINQAWLNRQWDNLGSYFHQDLVNVMPGFAGRAEGRDAAVASYREFMTAAEVEDFIQSDEVVDLFVDTAIATCKFDIKWTEGAQAYHETGHEVLVFQREGGVWLAIWRMMVPGGAAT